MTPAEGCPDCLRPFAKTVHQQAHGNWCMERHSDGCARRTITRLRDELAEAKAKIDELETQVFELQMGDDL